MTTYTKEETQEIKAYITEGVEEMKVIAAANEQITDYAAIVKERFGMIPSEFKKLTKNHYEAFLEDKRQELDDLITTYEDMFITKTDEGGDPPL